jgi:hypothetical protein
MWGPMSLASQAGSGHGVVGLDLRPWVVSWPTVLTCWKSGEKL